MAIDNSGLPSTPQQPGSSLLQQLYRPLPAPAQTPAHPLQSLTLQPGETLLAKISAVQLLSNSEIKQLQQAIQQQTAPSLQQILKQPQIYLVELTSSGSKWLAIMDRPVKAMQTIQISMAQQQAIWRELPVSQALTSASQNRFDTTKTTTTSTPAQAIASSLRHVMAQQQPLSNFIKALITIQPLASANNTQQKANTGNHQPTLLPREIQQTVSKLLQRIPTLNQLSQHQELKMSMKNHGVLWESSLAKQIADNRLQTPTDSNKITSHFDSRSLPLPDNQKTALVKLLVLINTALRHSASESTDSTAVLAAAQPLSVNNKTPGQQTTAIEKLVLALLGKPLTGTPSLPPAETQRLLLKSLQQQLVSAVARMQFLQLQSLHQVAGSQTEGITQQPLILEIPYRHGDSVHTLDLRIQREHDDQEEQKKAEKKKTQAWHVVLSFEIPAHGKIHAQLVVKKNNLDAKLWIEQKSLLSAAKNNLQLLHKRLEKSGICVENFQCFHGKPPQDDFAPGFALVDIHT